MKSIKEQLSEEFMALAPEYGKWKIDRNIAKAFLLQAIDRVLDDVEKDLNKQIIVKDISGKWSEEVLDFTKDIADRVLYQVKQIIKSKK